MSECNYDDLLTGACEFSHFDQSAKVWNTDDGKWYSLSSENLRALQQMIENLRTKSRLGMICQVIIRARALDLIKSILSSPSPNRNDETITRLTWQLMFNLVETIQENRVTVWNECGDFLLDFLRQNEHDNGICSMVLYMIYVVGRLCDHEGPTILKILLNRFVLKKQAGPLKQQELTMFIEHYISSELNIAAIYETLNGIEKMALAHFVIDHVNRVPVVEFAYLSLPLSQHLLSTICNDFNAKSETLFQSSYKDETQTRELFALFECVAHISNSKDYALDDFIFELLRNVGQLTRLIVLHEDDAERVFSAVKRNSDEPLKYVILSTISNLVKDNSGHKEKARYSGIIDNLVDLMAAKGHDKTMYRCTIFALIDICQTSPINMDYAEQILKKKDLVRSPIFRHFISDINYKSKT